MTLQLEKRSTIFQKDKAASSNFNWHIPHPKIKTHTHTHTKPPRGSPFLKASTPPQKKRSSLFYGLEPFFGVPCSRNPFFLLWLGEKIIGSHCEKKHHRGSSSKSCATRVIVTRRPRKRCDVWWMAKGRWCSDLGHGVLGVGDWVVGWWLVTVIEGGWPPPPQKQTGSLPRENDWTYVVGRLRSFGGVWVYF